MEKELAKRILNWMEIIRSMQGEEKKKQIELLITFIGGYAEAVQNEKR